MRIAVVRGAFLWSATIWSRKVRVRERVGRVMKVGLRRFCGWWVGVDVDCARRDDVEKEAKRCQTSQMTGIVRHVLILRLKLFNLCVGRFYLALILLVSLGRRSQGLMMVKGERMAPLTAVTCSYFCRIALNLVSPIRQYNPVVDKHETYFSLYFVLVVRCAA